MIKLITNLFKPRQHDPNLRAGIEVQPSIQQLAHAAAVRNAMH